MRRKKDLDITDILTPEGVEKIEIGTYLKFDHAELVVTKKTGGRVYARKTVTALDTDQEIHEKHIADVLSGAQECEFCKSILRATTSWQKKA